MGKPKTKEPSGRDKRRRINAAGFDQVYKIGLWGRDAVANDGFFSGPGSVGAAAAAYVQALVAEFSDQPGLAAVDLGCGDFRVGSRIRSLFDGYIACDVAPSLIERNNGKYADLDVDFRALDITSDPLPAANVALCRQVLQHLSNADIRFFLRNLRKTSYRWLVLTEEHPAGDFVPNQDSTTGPNTRLHLEPPSGVVLTEPPFDLRPVDSKVLLEHPVPGVGIIRTTLHRLTSE